MNKGKKGRGESRPIFFFPYPFHSFCFVKSLGFMSLCAFMHSCRDMTLRHLTRIRI